jgi:MSHA biogenesis protein MshP
MKNIATQYQRGFLLPLAIFIMVILAGMGVYAMRLTVLANQSTTQDILGTQAYLAARAGYEWAAYQIYRPADTPPVLQNCPANQNLVLNGFNVAVSCVANNGTAIGSVGGAIDNGSQNISVYEITSTATQGAAGTANYIERVVRLTLSRCVDGGSECN